MLYLKFPKQKLKAYGVNPLRGNFPFWFNEKRCFWHRYFPVEFAKFSEHFLIYWCFVLFYRIKRKKLFPLFALSISQIFFKIRSLKHFPKVTSGDCFCQANASLFILYSLKHQELFGVFWRYRCLILS